MSSQEEFIQHQQMLHQQQSELLQNFQSNLQSATPNGEALLSNLENILNVIEARTTSIASHLHQANHLTSISAAVNQVQTQNQESIAQQTNMITTMQNLVKNLINVAPAQPAANPGRAPVPHPFTPAFNGDAKVLSFRAFKAKLNGVFQRFTASFQSDEQCVTYAMACMGGPPLEYFAPVYNGDVEDVDQVLENYEAFMDTLESAYGDKLSVQEAEVKIRFLHQRGTMQDYLAEFSTLQSQVRWNQAALVAQFKFGLSEPVRGLLQSQWHSLNTLKLVSEAATTAYQNLRLTNRRAPNSTPWPRNQNQPQRIQFLNAAARANPTSNQSRPGSSDMELGAMKGPLTAREKERRRKEKLCLYCGEPGHFTDRCPAKRPGLGLAMINDQAVDYTCEYDTESGKDSA